MLGAIRRGLRRGPLPADQQAMLRARLARPPRHLIPARSQIPRPDQITLLVRNIEKEFGTVTRVPDADAVPDAVADYLAAQNLPSELRHVAASGAAGDAVVAPAAAADPRGPGRGDRPGQRAARLRRASPRPAR